MPFSLSWISRCVAFTLALVVVVGSASAAGLPPVPDAIKDAGLVRVGTKCDYPPYGYLDNQGKPQGVEVNLGRQIAKYALGDSSKVELVCVTSANRIPSLVGGKIDVIIATMGINAKRKEVIDFTDPYAWGGSEIVVPSDSSVKGMADLKGKTVVFIKGAWQIPWFEKNLPDVQTLKLDSVSDALQALLQGRADAYAHDLTVLAGLAKNNKKIRLGGEVYQIGFTGAGVRKGETEWRDFVSAAIKKAAEDGLTAKWIREHVEPDLQDAVMNTWDLDKAPKS